VFELQDKINGLPQSIVSVFATGFGIKGRVGLSSVDRFACEHERGFVCQEPQRQTIANATLATVHRAPMQKQIFHAFSGHAFAGLRIS